MIIFSSQKSHNDTSTLVFSNKNAQNVVKNRYLKDCIMWDDMLLDLFSMFQNPLTLIFSLEKKLPGSVKGNKNSHLSLLSLATMASITLKWTDRCSKKVLKQQESRVNMIRSFTVITMINFCICCNWHCQLFSNRLWTSHNEIDITLNY